MITIPPNTYHSDLTALFWSYHPTDKEDDKLYELIRKVCKAELVHRRDNIEESLISKLVLTDEERLLVDKYKLTEHENIEVKARFLDVMLRFATGNCRIEKTRTASDAYLLLFKETNVNTYLVRCLQIRVIGRLYDEHFLKELKSLIISSFIHPGWLSEIINVIIKYIDGGLGNSHVQDILRAYQAKVDNQSTEWCDKYYDMLNAVGAISVEEYHYKKAVNWERRADFDEANKKENVFNARTHSIYEDAYKEIEKVQNNYHEDFLRIRDKYNQAKFAYSQILSQYGHKSEYGVPDQLVDDINKQMSCVTVRSLDESIHADFFIKWSNKLQIYSCYYCEMAYVNTYTQKGRKGVVKRQFDLDHFLPKAKCPCVALSLFNFVPSCQVCNSRIKSDKLPKMTKAEYEMVSPSPSGADFDKHITFKLRMSAKGTGLMGKRYVYVKADPPYHKYVRFFHLQERYGFHLKEAIRLKELKQRYPDSAIRKIASMLGYGEYRVKEDIFQEQHLKQEGRCFAKFTIDMLTK